MSTERAQDEESISTHSMSTERAQDEESILSHPVKGASTAPVHESASIHPAGA
jgi:hypothetical protein